MSEEWRGKTFDELAVEIPETTTAVGELEHVRQQLREVLASPNVRDAVEECMVAIEGRIEKLDESGRARAWTDAWRQAEEAEPARRVRKRG